MKRHQAELWFDLILAIAIIVVFVIPSFELSNSSRLVPLGAALITVSIIALRIIRVFLSSLKPVASQLAEKSKEAIKKEAKEAELESSSSLQWRDALLPILWLVLFAACIYLLGMVLAGALFTILFIRFYGKQSWLVSVLSSIVVVALIYGLFGIAMRFPLFHGILQVRLPGLI